MNFQWSVLSLLELQKSERNTDEIIMTWKVHSKEQQNFPLSCVLEKNPHHPFGDRVRINPKEEITVFANLQEGFRSALTSSGWFSLPSLPGKGAHPLQKARQHAWFRDSSTTRVPGIVSLNRAEDHGLHKGALKMRSDLAKWETIKIINYQHNSSLCIT